MIVRLGVRQSVTPSIKLNTMKLLLDNSAECDLEEFLDANTTRKDADIIPIDDEDVETIKALEVGQDHYIPVHFGWCQVKRTA